MAVPNPTQKPQPSKRLFMWATRGSRLAAKLYVSKDAAESCYGETAKRRAGREGLDFRAGCSKGLVGR